ncbi:MAG: glycine cleavage system aminomethyltransferase GcvT [Actinomycetes bacterium]
MKLSPLNSRHVDLQAKMADFGGWLMPIDYPATGVLTEHASVREAVGIFDVSHLGKASVRGAGALDFLNGVLTNDLTRIVDGQAQYTLICNPAGGVIDDLIAYRNSADDFFLVPNAANTGDVVAYLKTLAPAGIEIVNLHESYGVIAVQGPKSVALLNSLGVATDMDYMNFSSITIDGRSAILCRTGYTGELGFEILPSWDDALAVWDCIAAAMVDFGGVVCGLGARDTLRTEMGYPLHGHELSLEITPVQASANWAIGWEKETFSGADVLRQQKATGAVTKMRGLLCVGKGIPRGGMDVKDSQGAVIGKVTSGTFSPTLKNGIALALVSPSVKVGDHLKIDVRGRDLEVEVVTLPFVASHVR